MRAWLVALTTEFEAIPQDDFEKSMWTLFISMAACLLAAGILLPGVN